MLRIQLNRWRFCSVAICPWAPLPKGSASSVRILLCLVAGSGKGEELLLSPVTAEWADSCRAMPPPPTACWQLVLFCPPYGMPEAKVSENPTLNVKVEAELLPRLVLAGYIVVARTEVRSSSGDPARYCHEIQKVVSRKPQGKDTGLFPN